MVSFGKYQSVKVDHDSYFQGTIWGKSWPDGIRLNNRKVEIPSMATLKSQSNSTSKPIRPIRVQTFSWVGESLLISFEMSSLSNVSCSRLFPPITWLSASGSKVKVLYNNANSGGIGSSVSEVLSESVVEGSDARRWFEVTVQKTMAEESLSALRMFAFQREDIYRMLDKAPWILALDVSKALPKTKQDLESSLGVTSAQFVHILSHCPYLLAQCCRYKGRDLHATVLALLELEGDSSFDPDSRFRSDRIPSNAISKDAKAQLLASILRFPSMLAAPPERLLGWRALMRAYNIADRKTDRFGRFMRKAPFMYYINPPQLFDIDVSADDQSDGSFFTESQSDSNTYMFSKSDIASNNPNRVSGENFISRKPILISKQVRSTSTTASGYVSYDTLGVLTYLRSILPSPDAEPSSTSSSSQIDKIVRTQPNILLAKPRDIKDRVRFLVSTVLQPSVAGNVRQLVVIEEEKKAESNALLALLLAYPAVLSIDVSNMIAAYNALLSVGLTRQEIEKLVMRNPAILGTNPASFKDIASFLKQNCGISKSDLPGFLLRCPGIFAMNVPDLQQKLRYLFKSLGFTPYNLKKGVVATKWNMNPLCFIIPIFGVSATYIFTILVMLFPEISAFVVAIKINRVFSFVTYLLLQVYWFYCLWRHYQSNPRFGIDEMKEITYMVGELIFLFFLLTDFIISTNTVHFVNTDERFLIIYYIIVIICCLIMTVLPGRLLRKLSEIKESVLQMKREFVRYLSHEIRSPLNVSHAGLEILKAELEVMGASLEILNLVDDIFSLELAVTPLRSVFAGRLEAYKYMATKKGIDLRIEDLVHASEYYAGDDDAGDSDGDATKKSRLPHREADADADPIAKLQDKSLDKTVAGYLRFEVVDSGAGSIPCSDFHSAGEGTGSTFAVELPIYSRTVDHHEASDLESVVSIPASSRPRPRLRATNIVQVLPVSSTSEKGTSHSDAITERAAQKLSVLIVDDSSANR
eukprot:gene28711-37703_t